MPNGITDSATNTVVPEIAGDEPAPAAEEATQKHKGRRQRPRKQAAAPQSGPEGSEPQHAPLHPFFRKMQVMRVDREKINPAPYNPRDIDVPGTVKLKAGLREFGMVELLILNLRTGNLVGGHQRLKIMDQEIGRDSGYSVECNVIDVSETKEKELNVLLNNPGAQGFYDYTKLGNMLASDVEIDAEAMGFDLTALKADLQAFAPDVLEKLDFTHIFGDPEQKDDPAAADAEEIRAMKASKEDYKEVAAEAGKDGFYINVVFGTIAEKEKWCEAFGINPQAKHCLGRVIARNMRPTISGEEGVDIGFVYPKDPDMDAHTEQVTESEDEQKLTETSD